MPRIGISPFFPTIFIGAVNADAPCPDVRPLPILVHFPALKTSKVIVLPAFAAPVSTTICAAIFVKLTRVASHERDCAGAVD